MESKGMRSWDFRRMMMCLFSTHSHNTEATLYSLACYPFAIRHLNKLKHAEQGGDGLESLLSDLKERHVIDEQTMLREPNAHVQGQAEDHCARTLLRAYAHVQHRTLTLPDTQESYGSRHAPSTCSAIHKLFQNTLLKDLDRHCNIISTQYRVVERVCALLQRDVSHLLTSAETEAHMEALSMAYESTYGRTAGQFNVMVRELSAASRPLESRLSIILTRTLAGAPAPTSVPAAAAAAPAPVAAPIDLDFQARVFKAAAEATAAAAQAESTLPSAKLAFCFETSHKSEPIKPGYIYCGWIRNVDKIDGKPLQSFVRYALTMSRDASAMWQQVSDHSASSATQIRPHLGGAGLYWDRVTDTQEQYIERALQCATEPALRTGQFILFKKDKVLSSATGKPLKTARWVFRMMYPS